MSRDDELPEKSPTCGLLVDSRATPRATAWRRASVSALSRSALRRRASRSRPRRKARVCHGRRLPVGVFRGHPKRASRPTSPSVPPGRVTKEGTRPRLAAPLQQKRKPSGGRRERRHAWLAKTNWSENGPGRHVLISRKPMFTATSGRSNEYRYRDSKSARGGSTEPFLALQSQSLTAAHRWKPLQTATDFHPDFHPGRPTASPR